MQIDSDNTVLMQRPSMPDRAAVALIRCTEAVYSFSAAVAFSSTVAVSAVRDVNVSNHLIIHNHSGTDIISHIIR